MSKQKQYSQEFRDHAVELTLSGEKSVPVIARELGIRDQTLYNWRKAYHQRQGSTAVGSDSLAEENAALRRELKRVREERDILKKAIGYFADPSTR